MWGPIIAAGIQAGGSLLGGAMGAAGASATNAQQMAFAQQQQQQSEQFNAEQAQLNRDWQERMSGTAYQRAMSDMRTAGLNPILAANLGGASTPGGSSASISGVSPGTLSNAGAAAGAGVASAAQAGTTFAMTKSALAQAEKDTSQTELNDATRGLNNATTDRVKQETVNSAKTADLITAQTGAARAQEGASTARAAYDAAQTVIAGHDANTAFQRSILAKREADDRTRFGPGVPGDVVASGARIAGGIHDTARDLGEKAWTAYSENVGKPFADWVRRMRGGETPGLTIDVTKPNRR